MDESPRLETITRSYESFEDARNVVVRLAEAGIAPERIGLLGHQAGGDDSTALGAGVGGAAGAATGFIIGLGAITLPGVGPIIAAGWFLSGAVVGALAGGVVGALVDAGVPTDQARSHAEDHSLGASVLSVRTEGVTENSRAMAIMDAGMPIERDRRSDAVEGTHSSEAGPVATDLSKAVS